ncbi:MAG: hypothetical protein WCY70_02545 [Methanoculleus sp.]
MVVTPGLTEELTPSGFFDIFRLAARAHGPLPEAFEPFTALFAAVILALHPIVVKLDIDWSANSTHTTSPGERWAVKDKNTIAGIPGKAPGRTTRMAGTGKGVTLPSARAIIMVTRYVWYRA